jgi:hypothetical protein
MNWVLVVWLASSNNYTIYEKFPTQEDCVEKQATVIKALKQADSKMKTECRMRKPGDVFNKSDIVVTRYILR